MTDDILNRIDDTLDGWDGSADSARWAGGPEERLGAAMRDDLDDAIAAEQHRNGRAWLAEPEHCEGCAEVDRAWAQAVCEHNGAETITLSSLGCGVSEELFQCHQCGTTKRIETNSVVWG